MYTENYRHFFERNERRHPCSWIRRPNTVEMAELSKLICRCTIILIKFPASLFFVAIDHSILKFIWKEKGSIQAKTIFFKKRTKLEDSPFPISKFTTKPQRQGQWGVSTRQAHRPTGQNRESGNDSAVYIHVRLTSTKVSRQFNGEK